MTGTIGSSNVASAVVGTGFTKPHQMFRDSVRQFVDAHINPYVDEWEEAESFPAHDLFKKMGDQGFLGLSYDEEFGGLAGDYWYNVVLAEELGRIHCTGVPMAIAVQTDMATPALHQYGSEQLKQQFLAPAIAGDAVCAVAITESGAGSDVAAICTKAVRDGDEYVLNGNKMYITNGTQADWMCVLARTSESGGYEGMSLLIVPTDVDGFHVAKKLKKLGNRASDTAEIVFDEVRIPVANRIGEEGRGFQYQMGQFQTERLIMSLGSLAAADQAIQMTIEYCRGRCTFGKPLIDNQWIQFKLSELLTDVECLRQMCYHCARKLEAGVDFTREASMAKLKAGRVAREVADTCLQFHGGMGYMEEYPLARYFRDARLMSIGAGADEIMLKIIAKHEGMSSEM
jgi:citronellyl-CoA dehydrogenase